MRVNAEVGLRIERARFNYAGCAALAIDFNSRNAWALRHGKILITIAGGGTVVSG